MRYSNFSYLCAAFCVFAGFILVALPGCDDVPTFNEITGQQQQQQPAAQPLKPKVNTTPAAKPIARQRKTDAQIIAEFREKRPTLIDDADLAELFAVKEGLEEVESLDITSSNVTGKGLEGVEKLPNLTKVDATRAKNIDDTAMDSIAKVSSITELTLVATRITGAGLQRLAELPNLEKLSIAHTLVGDDDLSALSGLNNLRELNISNTKLTDAAFVHLSSLAALEKFDVSFTPTDGSGFEELKGLANLKDINASNTNFGRYGFQAIRTHRQLERLTLGTCGIIDDAVLLAKSLTNLKYLHVGQNRISNKGMTAFSSFRQLETLNLYNNRGVSDLGISYLKSLKKLKELNLDGTACTGKAVKGMQHFVPGIKIKLQGQNF